MSTQVRFTGGINVEPAISETDLDALDDLAGPLDESSSAWRVSESRRELIPGDPGSFIAVQTVLNQFAQLLGSRGYALSGRVSWAFDGFHPGSGMVFVRGAAVEWVEDRVVNPGPSWEPGEWIWDGQRHRPASVDK
jgi:hypothetical protein